MVVLDGQNMLGAGPNQYLQPDYLSPLPTTLDAKKSPLALLAQTCSQIGADSPNTKSLLPSSIGDSNKRKSSSSSETSSLTSDQGTVQRPKSSGSSSGSKAGKSSPAFKPYETSKTSSSSTRDSTREEEPKAKRPKSEISPRESRESRDSRDSRDSRESRDSRNDRVDVESTKVSSVPEPPIEKEESNHKREGKVSPKSSASAVIDQGASPIIRSGLEVLHGHLTGSSGKDFGKSLAGLSALGYPTGFDPSSPALRPPFFPPAHHFMGYPPTTGSPYVGYTRVKTPSGAETIVPVCKDPYCTGCQLSVPGLMSAYSPFPQSASGGVCPAGCVQCDHQKFPFPSSPFLPPPGLGGMGSSAAAAAAALAYPGLLSHHHAAQQQAAVASAQRPFVCNWVVSEGYCGKRFPSSDELLQHLRSHTGAASEAGGMPSQAQALYSSALLGSSALHRNYPTPPLSPLSAARYHPYGKPPQSPFPPSLATYYSPYSLYGQRIGPPVHP